MVWCCLLKASIVSMGRLPMSRCAGKLKDVGKIYMQTVVDTYSSLSLGTCTRENCPAPRSSHMMLLQFLLHVDDVKGAAQFEADILQASGMYKALAGVEGHALFVFRRDFRKEMADALLDGRFFQPCQTHAADAFSEMGGGDEVSNGGGFPERGYGLVRAEEAKTHNFSGLAVYHGIRRVAFHTFQNLGVKGFRKFRIRKSGRSLRHVMVEDTHHRLPVGFPEGFQLDFSHRVC